ncbi:MAG: hypothetical protein LH609_11700 [Rudanella sp.]|nr:hypothetical protein [Rudanella sp.]
MFRLLPNSAFMLKGGPSQSLAWYPLASQHEVGTLPGQFSEVLLPVG